MYFYFISVTQVLKPYTFAPRFKGAVFSEIKSVFTGIFWRKWIMVKRILKKVLKVFWKPIKWITFAELSPEKI